MNRLIRILPVILLLPLASCATTDNIPAEVSAAPSASRGECHCNLRKRQQVEARMKKKELEAE